MILAYIAAALAAEPIDARGFWVADTAANADRSLRLLDPDIGQGWDVGFLSDTARNTLMESTASGGATPIVPLLSSAHVYGGLAWHGRRFSAALPVTLYGQDLAGGFAGMGDLRLGVMQPIRPMTPGRLGLSFEASGWLPTGTSWGGSPGPAAAVVAALGLEGEHAGWTANAGVRMGWPEEARNLLSGPGPIGGLEIHATVTPSVVVGLEAVSQGSTGMESWPMELGGRLRYRHSSGGFAFMGFYYGVGEGVGASSGRAALGVGYGAGRPLEPAAPVVVPVLLSQHRSEVQLEAAPVAELIEDRIVLYQQIFFAEGRAEILEESTPVMEAVLQILKDHPEISHLLIEGHTNSRGSDTYNQLLSDARSQAVAAWLLQHGISDTALLPRGFGEDRPLVPEDHPEAMAINRRVEFLVLRTNSDPAPVVPDIEAIPPQLREGALGAPGAEADPHAPPAGESPAEAHPAEDPHAEAPPPEGHPAEDHPAEEHHAEEHPVEEHHAEDHSAEGRGGGHH